jgi:hypothetical protein
MLTTGQHTEVTLRPWQSGGAAIAGPRLIRRLCSLSSALLMSRPGSGHFTGFACMPRGFLVYERFRGEVKRLQKDPGMESST